MFALAKKQKTQERGVAISRSKSLREINLSFLNFFGFRL